MSRPMTLEQQAIWEWLRSHELCSFRRQPSTKNSLESSIREAAQLIAKAVPTKGLMDGSVFPSPGGAYHPIDGAYPIAQSDAGVLRPGACLRPMVGVAFYEGEQVLVIGPWFVSFKQLSAHGYISEEEVQQLLAAASKIDRALYRVIRRKSIAARAMFEAAQQQGGAA